MFAGAAGCFAAGTELALLSGSGGRTSFEGSGARIAGCAIFVSSCGGIGGRLEGACCCVFSTGKILAVVTAEGNALVKWPRCSACSPRWLGVLTVSAGEGFLAGFAGVGECFGEISGMLSIFSAGKGGTIEVCTCVLLVCGFGTLGVVVMRRGATGFTTSLNAAGFC